MNSININFVNQSNDEGNLNVVFFQKNVSADDNETTIAWKVIKECKNGENYRFKIPLEVKISVLNAKGQEIVKPDFVKNGRLFKVIKDPAGHRLAFAGKVSNSNEVQLRNDLEQGSIDANIYKAGKLLAIKKGISPSQNAVFHLNPVMGVGVIPQVKEGQLIDSATLSNINTVMTLTGIVSADIIMTGGGVGPNSTPYQFVIENIVKA